MVSGGWCDESGDPAGADPVSASSAVSDQSAVSEKESKEIVTANSGPVLPVTMKWLDFAKGSEVASGNLSMEIKNISNIDYTLNVGIVSSGLLSTTMTGKVGTWNLPAGETVIATIPASRVPVQVTNGSCQARMELSLSTQSSTAEKVQTVRYVSSIVNYRHASDYKSLSMFDEETLINQFQGKLFEMPKGAEKSAVTLGRVLDEEGNVREVKSTDAAFVSKSASGAIAGYQTGAFIHSGIANDEAEVAK